MSKKTPPSAEPLKLSRRQLLAGLAGAPAVAALASCSSSLPGSIGTGGGTDTGNLPALPDPESLGIEHIVVVMMENRSFDHMLGWVPGADGRQDGHSFPNKAGEMIPTFRLSQDSSYGFQGCNYADPDHGYTGGRIELNDGKCDGFLLTDGTSANAGDHFPIGYYTAEDLPFYKGAAESWTVCDKYHCGLLSSTLPNRVYMHAGQTDRNENTLTVSQLDTIWDRLAAKNVSGAYYAPDLPMTVLWGTKHLNITRPYASFLLEATLGTLPSVCYVDPAFGFSVGEGPGVSRDDHPHADVRDGQAFLNQIYDALRNGPKWDKTLLIINYDEWGGFADHVVPPFAPVSDDERNNILPQGNDGRLGFRTPCVIIGPRAKKGHVEHMQFDPNSIINLICWRFGLDPLGVRAATSNNMAYALDLENAPRTDKPAFDVPAGLGGVPGLPFGSLCALQNLIPGVPLTAMNPVAKSMMEHKLEIDALGTMALRYGFSIGS